MNEEIKKEIQKEVRNLDSFFLEDIKRRVEASQEMQELIKRTKLLESGILSSKNLCESIKIQKKVQNINPIILPKVVGNYQYNVNFKGYTKSESEFVKEHPEYNGTSGHPGVNLQEYSQDLANLIRAKGNDFVDAFKKLREHIGVGIAILSGYLYLFDPNKYPLINDAAISGMEFFIGKQHVSLIKKYAEQEKEEQNITFPIKDAILRKYLAWSYLTRELLKIEGINNYHYVDSLLWAINKKGKKDHYFAISFGEEDISRWDDYLKKGYHAIGASKMNKDLTRLSAEEIEELYKEAYPDRSVNTRAAHMYTIVRFVNLEAGDKIIANFGQGEILAVGEVVSGYYFEKEADVFRHRVRVKWTDTRRRKIPNQHDWINTLKVLSEGLFDDLVSYKISAGKIDENERFTKETFEWFEGLHKNPTKKYFNETKFKFNQFVNTPFIALVKKVANELEPKILSKLETEKRVRSNILKNDYGIGNAYDYLWFAFYPKGSSRTKDAQLYCRINKDIVRYGFYIGDCGNATKNKFRNNIRQNEEEFIKRIKALQETSHLELYADNKRFCLTKPSLVMDGNTLDKWLSKDKQAIAVTVNKDDVIKKGDLSEDISSLFKRLYPIWLYAVDIVMEEEDGPEDEVDEQDIYTKESLIIDTYYEGKEINHILSEIERKKNVVFYGPPGTGKTFIAKKIARYLVEGRDNNIEYIQFHQNYAYEDFIEGIRPVSKEDDVGNVTIDYPVVAGIFRRLCEKASLYPKHKFVILIDEFNRGNISKIFGELLYLLEYRNKENSLILPYSKSQFHIPDNVYLIATMNTADRSLTHIDFAMMRRFSFIRFDVNTDILLKWGQQKGLVLDTLINFLDEINEQIEDENFFIGISYFMEENLPEVIESIWKHEICPYIKEYFINEGAFPIFCKI